MNYEAFFKITYGLYIVSTEFNGIKNGYIANTAFQVTAEPAQIAISCNKDNYTCGLIEKSKKFSISVLKQNVNADIIGLFGYNSGKTTNKFEQINHKQSKNLTPVVTEGCIAWFDCIVKQQTDVGSHIIFIAEIIENELLEAEGTPLTYEYYREIKKGKAPKNAPTYIKENKVIEEHSSKKNIKYRCLACGYIYDPEIGDPSNGIPPGTSFDDLPDDWKCPTCGSPKSMFEPE